MEPDRSHGDRKKCIRSASRVHQPDRSRWGRVLVSRNSHDADTGVMQFSGNECQLGFDETSKLPSITYWSSSSTRQNNGLARACMHDGEQARWFVNDRINRLEWDYQGRAAIIIGYGETERATQAVTRQRECSMV